MKKHIDYTGSVAIVTEAVEKADAILNNETFHQALSAITHFEYANATGEIISKLIKECTIKVEVKFYSKRFTKANAYTKPKYPNSIFLNDRRLNRSVDSIAATLVHEYIHLLDYANDEYFFGHAGNRSRGKENTAPYKIDHIVYEMLSKKEPRQIQQDDEEEMTHLNEYKS